MSDPVAEAEEKAEALAELAKESAAAAERLHLMAAAEADERAEALAELAAAQAERLHRWRSGQ